MTDDDTKHDSLKYHLLGPSLTKAGQESVNQAKVSEIIYNASKGSKYFNNEEVKDKVLTEKIQRILAKKADLEKLDLSPDLRRADDHIASLEASRDLSQVIIHVDCDAFYAAVEELDQPELAKVPMAVGKGVLTTCNYKARAYGCRSGMAGFVAKKLCPELIFLPLNFAKYAAKAQEVREVLAIYDPRFESASMDEAYLNLTAYCTEHDLEPEAAVSQLRAEVFEKTSLTVSAGIGANAKIAKICSNKNKPNGQFYVPSERPAIMDFMRDLPTRKVNGIGRVFERELDALGIRTCGDIHPQRGYLTRLFGEKAFQFLINCHLGLGRTCVQPSESYTRKSVGTERTFGDCSSSAELHLKLRQTAESLAGDLARTNFKARTLCLKIKLFSYEVLTRQIATPTPFEKADVIFDHALPMLRKLEKEIPGLKLRLMGLRATQLISTKKADVASFFGGVAGIENVESRGVKRSAEGKVKETGIEGEWEVWPEAEFEESVRREREADAENIERCSQELELALNEEHWKGFETHSPEEEAKDCGKEVEEAWNCPVCGKPQTAEDRAFNDHIDFCLSKGIIKRAADAFVEDRKPRDKDQSTYAIRVSAAEQKTLGQNKKRRLFFTH
ncbi:MAG: hypothetical protein M1814_002130 [Vezdaea aestivalis]|nr:MAG: hypothetical protein M1814_002130 [Vezdaea aestivalis]